MICLVSIYFSITKAPANRIHLRQRLHILMPRYKVQHSLYRIHRGLYIYCIHIKITEVLRLILHFGFQLKRYTDLGDIFSEIGDISVSAPPSATSSKLNSRQIPTPTSASSIAIPRPPSRRSEATIGRGRVSPSSISRADSVGSLEFRTASIGFGSSRGPSPLTIGITDTIPLAVAFHEIVHAFFKLVLHEHSTFILQLQCIDSIFIVFFNRGSDEARCQVKMSGDMMLSFPAGIVSVFANNPSPAQLGFRIKNMLNLENLSPNKQLVAM